MKKFQYIISIACITAASLLVSCEVDNYDAPDGIMTGRVIDATTGIPIISEQPNGYQIRYDEISWSDNPTPQYLWGKADGTFQNTKMFAGTYEVSAVNGAFISTAVQTITIKSEQATNVEFTVTPYISFSNVSIVKEGATVRATFTLSRNIPDAALVDYRVFASAATHYVGATESDASVSVASVAITEADLGVPISVLLPAQFVSGKTYYIRVGAKCENPNGRYNMTEIVSIQF
ncbi:MAG: DUF3823 domain-containing protein [Tannerella sp.]|jgi:hypothetical protein|nr:DUF3823 domain-containing protein [Tannerella sp.]